MLAPHISRTTKIILIAEFILLAYMLYVLTTSLYKSYQIDRFIETAAQENERLAEENKRLASDFEYYSSPEYKEKIAKQNFGLVRPGEEVIILAPERKQYVSPQERAAEISQNYYNSLSNPQKWFLFFFDRERFTL